ncbi:hypothetical protein Hanom_Chr04g00303581 [Helianthus anomalus]
MLNFANKCRILHFKWVLGTFRHLNYHLVTQFYDPHFPTHYPSVILYFWLILGLKILSVYVLALSV